MFSPAIMASSWLTPQHLQDASHVLKGIGMVLARQAADRFVTLHECVAFCGDMHARLACDTLAISQAHL